MYFEMLLYVFYVNSVIMAHNQAIVTGIILTAFTEIEGILGICPGNVSPNTNRHRLLYSW